MQRQLCLRVRTFAAARRASTFVLVLLAGALGVAMVPAVAGASSPIALSAPQYGEDPLVAYDVDSKETFVAWSNPHSSGGIELCVLPSGASGCSGGGPVLLSVSSAENPKIMGSNTISLGGLVVLANGDVVVIGTPVEEGSVAWESPADGSAFLTSGQGLQDGGGFISPVSLFYTFGNAVALSNTDVGLLDDYGDYFSDSPFSGPESPAIASKNSNQGNGGLYPRKPLGVSGSEVGAEPAPAPAAQGTDIVVGVGDNYAGPNTTLPGCVNSAGTGYGVSVGTVNGASNGAGTLNGEGLPGYALLACSAEDPVIASGGTDGMGVLENEGDGISGAGKTYTLDYRRFMATATGGSFGAPVQLASLTDTADDLDVVDDSGTGVYAMWSQDGLHVDYSPNGGVSWDGPVLVSQPAVGEIANPVIAGVGDGTLLLGYKNNTGTGTETFLQELDAVPSSPAPTLPSSATSNGSTVTFTISCAAACSVTITIELPSGSASEARKNTKSVTLASGHFTLGTKGKKNLSLKLTGSGKSLLKKDHGKLSALLLVTDKTAHGTLKSSKTLKITTKK